MNLRGFPVRGDFCIFILAVIIMTGGMVSGNQMAWEGDSKAGAAAELALRTMTYNIRVDTALDLTNRWTKRRQMVCDIISDYRPDILGLQEALKRQVDDIVRTIDGYRMIGVGRKDGKTRGEYSCILYRSDRFDVGDSGTFWLSNTPDVPGSRTWGNIWTRICTWARFVDRATGKAFYMYNLHMDCLSQRCRENSAKLLVSRIRGRDHDDPFVVTGDFNAAEENPAMRFLTGRESLGGERSPVRMIDAFRVMYPFGQDVRTSRGLSRFRKDKRIDYILTDPGIRVLNADIIQPNYNGRHPSDHFPVTATLMIN